MKRIISILTVVILLLSCPVAMADYVVPGLYYGTEGIYYYRQYEDEITILECLDKTLKSVEIPQTIKGLPVVGVDYEAFKEFANLESVTFPDTLTQIGSCAFYNCRKLETVNFPASLKTIGPSAFIYCVSLKEINLPEGVERIMNSAFANCSSLQHLVVPSSVKDIGYTAFHYCTSLKSVIFPDTTIKISGGAFANCTALESVKLPSMLSRIEFDLFSLCENLKSIELPDTLTYIGDRSFRGCPLTEISIPDSVTSIGEMAFSLTKIQSIKLPSAIENIGDYAFSNTCLTTIDIPKSITDIPTGMVANCESIISIKLHDGIQSIGRSAFYSTAITEIELPASVKEIGDNAFGFTDLKTVEIPDGVEFIAENLFTNCGSLKQVYLPVSVNTIYVRAIENCPRLTDIYYEGTRKQFKEIIINKFTTADLNGIRIHYNEPFEKETVDTSKKFNDVKAGKWYKQYIDYAYTNGIFDGMSKTTFAPESSITRAQFVMVLANLSGVYTNGYYVAPHKKEGIGFAFDDVGYSKWYSGAIAWAYYNDIVAGVSENLFGPNMPITREQMCTMLVRYANYCGVSLKNIEKKTTFADDKSISKWAKNAVYACQMADIVNGKGANKFDPKNTGTRAEAAVIFTKFRKSYLKGE